MSFEKQFAVAEGIQTEKNKYLAERIGVKCWHTEWIQKGCVTYADTWWECILCGKDGRVSNPNYFIAEDRQILLEWAVEQEWWYDFLSENAGVCCYSQFVPTILSPVPHYQRLYTNGSPKRKEVW